MKMNVYVPSKEHDLGIALGSGIVGLPIENGFVKIYYEGNIYSAVNLHSFKERIQVAGYRMRDRCPTTAFNVVPNDYLVQVGVYDTESQTIFAKDQEAIDQWASKYKHPNKVSA
jgi:pyruvate dehydrogenase complex dehydrogenase (E1) component